MKIDFADNELERCANDDRRRNKQMGKIRSGKYKIILDQMTAADNLEDLRYAPGHFHELTHDKKGLWSCDLDQPYRLIFQPQETPIPIDDYGKYIWSGIRAVTIIEIIDYH